MSPRCRRQLIQLCDTRIFIEIIERKLAMSKEQEQQDSITKVVQSAVSAMNEWQATADKYQNTLLGQRFIVIDKSERAFTQLADGRYKLEMAHPDLIGVSHMDRKNADEVVKVLEAKSPDFSPFRAVDFKDYALERVGQMSSLLDSLNTDALSSAQVGAIDAFRELKGRTWKAALRTCWEASEYPGMTTNQSAALQGLRNTKGPEWLSKFRLASEDVSPKKSKPITHEKLSDGQGVYEWNARLQEGLIETSLDLSKTFPMLSVSAATEEDWANKDSQWANADMGHLQTSIWIIDPAFRETAEKLAHDLLTGGKVVVGAAELEGLVISVGRRHDVVGNGANLISQDQNKQLDVEHSIREFHEEFGRVASLSYAKDDLERWVRENTELTIKHQSGFSDKNGLLKITYSLEGKVHECAFDTNSFVASAEKKESFESWKKTSFSEWANALVDGQVEGKNMNKSFDDKGAGFIVLTIDNTANAAFVDLGRNQEIARIIGEAASKIEEKNDLKVVDFSLRDVNGNRVGKVNYAAVAPADGPGEGKVHLSIGLSNDAFCDGHSGAEVSSILRGVAEKVGGGEHEFSVRDTNGNTVGKFEWREEASLDQDGILNMDAALGERRVFLAEEGYSGIADGEFRYVVTTPDFEPGYGQGQGDAWLVNAKGEKAPGYDSPQSVRETNFRELKFDETSELIEVAKGRVTFEDHERKFSDGPELS